MIIKDNLNTKNIKLLIYDVDGTLVCFQTLFNLLKESFEIHGIPFKKEYFDEYVLAVSTSLNEGKNDFGYRTLSNSFDEYFKIIKNYNVSGKDYLETLLNLEYKYTYSFDGVNETLNYLYKIYPQVISTNWFVDSQKAKINKFDLLKFFQKIYSCELYYPKPNKKHFERISNDYKLLPEECLIIGDSITDVKASTYGYNTLLVDYNSKKENIYDLSTYVVNDFRDIKKVLTRK